MEESTDPSSKVILIVDDDEHIRAFLETIVELDGYQVMTASNGTEALAQVQQKKPDLIITDLMMPDSGGFDVLRGLQSSGSGKIPVIVTTARKMDESTEKMIRAESNVADFLHKPIKVPVLQGMLCRILKTKLKKAPEA